MIVKTKDYIFVVVLVVLASIGVATIGSKTVEAFYFFKTSYECKELTEGQIMNDPTMG